MSNKKIEKDLRKMANWAAKMICDRESMRCPEQAVWALYPHMQLIRSC